MSVRNPADKCHFGGFVKLMSSPAPLVSVDFEVFGEVQGVFFRKYTEEQGRKLKLVGWVRNTNRDTVEGQVQGPPDAVARMKDWLRATGSPMSRIDRAAFSNEREIPALEFKDFTTKY
ncbi:acylphosphatase-2 [Amia ocellicauda]|uniref:acylphosphatase-2 n=1 Tax=Amia ocellicauda TaxID=2972642 RepID=UPI0034641B04